ncbi:hypothetical protein [Frigoribacterium sp. Leaf44]|uniref:hypothetical protein n=1 Tax=Frigoribacterium sp. Leaf44 TaxID=1736220 RepID=UPI0006F2742C|nr:hypothetical protein [Frigoribacterium sp. Leaf44]KQN39177.1 hypothetical protein ASE87_15320 [Frigoribacterium sp. Leaf44]
MATPTTPRLALGRPALAFGLLGVFAFLSDTAFRWWTFTRPSAPVRYVVVSSADGFDGFDGVQTIGGPLLLIAVLSIGFAVALLVVMLAHRLVSARPGRGGRAS